MSARERALKYISWSDIVEISAKLSHEVSKKFRPDVVVAIAKGGLIPARIVLEFLGVDEVGFVEVKFYKSIGVTVEKPYIKSMSVPPITGKNVLVVDDVVDSGRTMQLVVQVLSAQKPLEVKTLALYVKPWSTFIPDFYYAVVSEWIVFPWEVCEALKEGVIVDHEEYRKYSAYCSPR